MAEAVAPKYGHLWTSSDVARAFRVGVSSIKRWTDEGELEATKTDGGHRRYLLPNLYRFASIRNLPTDLLPTLEQSELFDPILPPADVTLLDALLGGDALAVRRLATPQVASVFQRATFLDRVVGEALREIGNRWERGELGVDEEHRATHMIGEAIDQLRPPITRSGRVALLACPPDEWHDLPLRLLRLVFEWRGWRTELAGASLPWSATSAAVTRLSPAVLALSARSRAPFDEGSFIELVELCERRGTVVISGGEWARGGSGDSGSCLRFRTLRGFEKWLRGV